MRGLLAMFVLGVAFLAVCGCLYIRDWREGGQGGGSSYATMAERVFGKEPKAVVVIDAGHGGKDQGTSKDEILEKDINLAVAKKIAKELAKEDIQVILTREKDTFVALEDRARIANDAGADYFVSIHCNYCEESSEVSGLECYYQEGSASGENLAEGIVAACEENASIQSRGTKEEDFSVLRNTKMPATLVELGYMSNRQERQKLISEEYQDTLVQQISKGILDMTELLNSAADSV